MSGRNHDAVRLQGVAGAARKAIANGRLPCILAAATTVIGLLSLLVSDILPIRMFGGFAAVTIFVTISLLFLMLPGAMYRWPVSNARGVTYGTLKRGPVPSFAWEILLPSMSFFARTASLMCSAA